MKNIAIVAPCWVPLDCYNNLNLKDTSLEYIDGIANRIIHIIDNLSKKPSFNITVFIPDSEYNKNLTIDLDSLPFKVSFYNAASATWLWSDELERKLKSFDFVITYPNYGIGLCNIANLPSGINIIVDGFVPVLAETACSLLGISKNLRKFHWERFLKQYSDLLLRANCILYATTSQYYYYEGIFNSIDKLNWSAFQFSPLLEVPYGFNQNPHLKKTNTTGKKLKLLWNGPVYPWYDPEKLIYTAQENQNIDFTFINIVHHRFKKQFKNYFKKFFNDAAYLSNIIIHEDGIYNKHDLFAEHDAVILNVRSWIEDKYAIRCRLYDAVSYGCPVLVNTANSFYKAFSNYENVVHTFNSDSSADVINLSKFIENKGALNISEETHSCLLNDNSWDKAIKPLIDYMDKV